jgi:hypothetical protein
MDKFSTKIFFIFVSLFFILSQKLTYAQIVPAQFYQANPKTYTYNGHANNLNPYGIEIYACNPEKGDMQSAQNTCIPGAQTVNGSKFWLNDINYNSSNANDTCTPAQPDFDAAPQSADTKTMNGTGQSDANAPICATTWATTSPFPFINVTKTFQYSPTFCNGGDEMVLATRSDPTNAVCQNLDVADVISHPQNYTQEQRNCLFFVDDHFTVQACKGSQCGSQQINGVAITGYGAHPDPLGMDVNVCSIFTAGAGSYQVTLKAFDQYQGSYGSSSVWLTDLQTGQPTPTPTLPPTYTISGNIFNDYNKDGLINNGETNNNSPFSLAINPNAGTITTNLDGTNSITDLPPGTYTVSYLSLPSGYRLTSPLNGPPPSFQVIVGGSCNTNGAPGAACQ